MITTARLRNLSALCLAAALGCASFAVAVAAETGNETLTNPDIIALARAKFPPEVIVAKINASGNAFDLSTRSMIALRENGVADEVISAMMIAASRPNARTGVDTIRYASELESMASGQIDSKAAGLAWMTANRETSLPLLRRSLADARPELRAAAAAALGRMGDRDSLPPLRNLLADAAPQVRQASAQALADLDDQAAIGAAEQAVARQVPPVDGYARLLGAVRLTRAAENLGKIARGNADPTARAAAAWALGEIGRAGLSGRADLEYALGNDADPRVRREAAAALAKFHEPQIAPLLEDACRRDPDVRKTILAAMAEYPETLEFLVGVMNLGAEQIAADELDTARASLTRLSGQDFGLDGQRWAEWFAANRSSLTASRSSLAAAPSAAPAASLSAAPSSAAFGAALGVDAAAPMPSPLPPPAAVPLPARPQVDLEAWSIVADSNRIPMAPQVEERVPGYAGPGLPPPANIPGALSPADFPATAATLTPGGGNAGLFDVPADLSGLNLGGANAASPEPSAFKTWSSDPGRTPGASAGRNAAPENLFPAAPSAAGQTGSVADAPWRQATAQPSAAAPNATDSAPASRSPGAAQQPRTAVVTPMTSSGVYDDASALMRGVSLPMPPMDGDAPSSGGASVGAPTLEGFPDFADMPLSGAPAGTSAAAPAALPVPDGAPAASGAMLEAPASMFAAPADPFAASADPFAAPADPFAAPSSDPFAAPAAPLTAPGGTPAAASSSSTQFDEFFTDDPSAVPGPAPSLEGFPDFPDAAAPASSFPAPPATPMTAPATPLTMPAAPTDSPSAPSAPPSAFPAAPPVGAGSVSGGVETVPFPGTVGSGTDASAAMLAPFTGGDGAASAVGAMPSEETIFNSSLFVEPEPGQLVIDEPLMPATPGAESVFPAAPPLSGQPVSAPPPAPTVPVAPGSVAAPIATQPIPSSPAPISAPAPAYAPPPAPVSAPAPASPSSSEEVFRTPSAPLPPVRTEGTVLPERGKEQPPMLGDGFFR